MSYFQNDSFEWDVDGEFDKNVSLFLTFILINFSIQESFTYWNGEKSITNMKKD